MEVKINGKIRSIDDIIETLKKYKDRYGNEFDGSCVGIDLLMCKEIILSNNEYTIGDICEILNDAVDASSYEEIECKSTVNEYTEEKNIFKLENNKTSDIELAKIMSEKTGIDHEKFLDKFTLLEFNTNTGYSRERLCEIVVDLENNNGHYYKFDEDIYKFNDSMTMPSEYMTLCDFRKLLMSEFGVVDISKYAIHVHSKNLKQKLNTLHREKIFGYDTYVYFEHTGLYYVDPIIDSIKNYMLGTTTCLNLSLNQTNTAECGDNKISIFDPQYLLRAFIIKLHSAYPEKIDKLFRDVFSCAFEDIL